jgi:hypothetical protein
MPTLRTKIHVNKDGTFVAHTAGTLPPGEHEATITVPDRPRRPPNAPDPDLVARMRVIAAELARVPDLDTRSADEILGYDEHGLPG